MKLRCVSSTGWCQLLNADADSGEDQLLTESGENKDDPLVANVKRTRSVTAADIGKDHTKMDRSRWPSHKSGLSKR